MVTSYTIVLVRLKSMFMFSIAPKKELKKTAITTKVGWGKCVKKLIKTVFQAENFVVEDHLVHHIDYSLQA